MSTDGHTDTGEQRESRELDGTTQELYNTRASTVTTRVTNHLQSLVLHDSKSIRTWPIPRVGSRVSHGNTRIAFVTFNENTSFRNYFLLKIGEVSGSDSVPSKRSRVPVDDNGPSERPIIRNDTLLERLNDSRRYSLRRWVSPGVIERWKSWPE